MEIWNTALYVVLFLALPALLKVNRFQRWYTYLFLIPLLVTWDTDFLSYNLMVNSDVVHLKGGKDTSLPTGYGFWTERIMNSFLTNEKTKQIQTDSLGTVEG